MDDKLWKEAIPEIVAGIVLLFLTYFVGTSLRPHYRESVYFGLGIVLLLALFLIFVRRHIWTGLLIVLAAGAAAFWLLVSTPLCDDLRAIQLKAFYNSTELPIPLRDHQVTLQEEREVKVQVKRLDGRDLPDHWNCKWQQKGDGEILQESGCTAVIDAGLDQTPELISVAVDSADCNYVIQEAVYLRLALNGGNQ